jgi:predicted membrane protein
MTNRKLFGLILVVLGTLFLLQKFEVFDFNIFFDGWWTLFLIVPALMSMSKQGMTTGNSVLLIIGVVLFLREQGVDLGGYLVPAVLILIGIGLFVRR